MPPRGSCWPPVWESFDRGLDAAASGPLPIVGTHFGVLVGRVVAGCQQFLEDRTGWTIK
jgi:hypothetical protein